MRTRDGFKSGFAAIRGTGERAGLTAGPVGTWVYQYRMALRITAVTIAVPVFIFQGTPSGLTVLVIAIILLTVLGLIELIGTPPAERAPAGPGHPVDVT